MQGFKIAFMATYSYTEVSGGMIITWHVNR